jgi:protoheme IX farnesyltransferase
VTTQALLSASARSFAQRARAYYALTKPRVVSLIVFTAIIGMFLATPGMVPPQVLLAGTVGIALVAGAAAAVNCLVERRIDATMPRTRARPLPRGELTPLQTLVFSGAIGGAGLWILAHYTNILTMWLTLATFVGYAIIYTGVLKPATPQNIVIGGASGAMPPVLGWAAVTGEVTTEAALLFLIIFAWTPPHFWSLALYRTEEYAKSGLPMLPVTHGKEYTALAGAALHDHPVRRIAAAVRDRHERDSLSRRRRRARRSVPVLCDTHLRCVQRCARAKDVPLLDRVSCVSVRRAAG